jgi:hypothetical protein
LAREDHRIERSLGASPFGKGSDLTHIGEFGLKRVCVSTRLTDRIYG